MHPEITARLRCPRDGTPLDEDGTELKCHHGHAFALLNGVIDLRLPSADDGTSQRTARSFGFEWTQFHRIEPEDEVFWRRYVRKLPLEECIGGVGLDAGCGKGRFTRFTAGYLDAFIALDASSAVTAAARNLRDLPNVAVVRADVRQPPVAEGTLRLVTCLGVLHHLSDPEEGFHRLARLLEPSGWFLLYVYSRPSRPGARALGLWLARQFRRVTVHFPHRLLKALCLPLAAALYWAVVFPGRAGGRRGIDALADLPLATYRGQPLRSLWLDTFDRLSAPVERRFVVDDVLPWFERAGLEVVSADEPKDLPGILVAARRRRGVAPEGRERAEAVPVHAGPGVRRPSQGPSFRTSSRPGAGVAASVLRYVVDAAASRGHGMGG